MRHPLDPDEESVEVHLGTVFEYAQEEVCRRAGFPRRRPDGVPRPVECAEGAAARGAR